MRTLLATVRPQRGERVRLALSVALAAGATGAAIALLSTSGYLISRAAQRPMIITLMVAVVAVLGLARAALRYCERLASHDLALRQIARLRTRFYRQLAPLVPGQLRGRSRGELLSRFVADVDTLQDAHLRVLIPVLVALVVIAGASLAGGLMLSAAGAGLLATLTAAAILSALASAKVAAAGYRNQGAARARLTSQLVEAIDGSAELALAGRSREHVRRLADSDTVLAGLARGDAMASALAKGMHSLLIGAGLVAVLVVAISGVRTGALPGVLLAALAFLFLGAGEAVAPLPGAARRLRACTASAKRVQEVCAQRPAITDPSVPERPAADGALELEHVVLRYDDEQAVLDDVDLRIEPGERVALIGPSGAGKTTMAELLVRFLEPNAGRVTLDGVDVRRLAQEDLRRAALLCGQDAHLFNTTIRENLLLARHGATDDELWDALAAVELDDFVAALSDGLETRVGQQGELLSGGQRRRLALARALLASARFLILDEPVAHLDAPLARRVMRRVLDQAGDRGVLVITHATDTLDGFDRVLRLDDGRVRPA